jgi:hypothetical protein
MLQRTSVLVRRAIEQEEAQCAYNRHVLTEVSISDFVTDEREEIDGLLQVQSVLDEMVYDVESCEHECELVRLRRQLATAESSLVEYQERESELIQERQQVRRACVEVVGVGVLMGLFVFARLMSTL